MKQYIAVGVTVLAGAALLDARHERSFEKRGPSQNRHANGNILLHPIGPGLGGTRISSIAVFRVRKMSQVRGARESPSGRPAEIQSLDDIVGLQRLDRVGRNCDFAVNDD